jgi:Flp pilus assembly protein TadG
MGNDEQTNNVRRKMAGQRGSAIIELAIVAPLLFMAFTGAAEFARVFRVAIAAASAARAGVQYGTQSLGYSSDLNGMQQAALNAAQGISGLTAAASRFCQCSDGAATSCGAGGCSSKRTYVKVTTTVNFRTMASYPWIPNPMRIRNQATMRVR